MWAKRRFGDAFLPAAARRDTEQVDDQSCGRSEFCGIDELDAALDRALFTAAMERVSSRHRAVLYRSYYLKEPIPRIAAALELSESIVKSRLHYGLCALRLALQELDVIPD